MKSAILIVTILITSLGTTHLNAQKTVIVSREGKWQLTIDNQPFFIKGVVGHTYMEKVAAYGGNSVRIGWSKDELDQANKLGLKALICLHADAERYGMNYDDSLAVAKQMAEIIEIVKKTKDHPAVLIWAIGNELDYIPGTLPFKLSLWDAVNNIAKAIKAIDPNHPVMTVIGTSMMEKVADIVKQCPDIDLLGVNTYGDIYNLSQTLKKYGWQKPYVITEWGPDGYWEVRKTSWNAPYEQTGREKYDCYENKYFKAIDTGDCLGSYVFYWFNKQETTHTWFSMFDEKGQETPLPKLMKMLWTGKRDNNLAPVVDSLNIDDFVRYQDICLKQGSKHRAKVQASDPDGDAIGYLWEIRPEAIYASYAGQGEKEPQPIAGLIEGNGQSISIKVPSQSGAYRLFVYAFDKNMQFSTANLPFIVK